MQYFTKIIGAKVISAHTTTLMGTVINMQLNKQTKQFTHLVIASPDETLMLLPIKKIYSLDDVVVVRNNSALLVTADADFSNLMNCEAISLSGKNLGKIKEIELDDKFKITNLKTDFFEISPNNLLGFNGCVALINDSAKKVSCASFAPKIKSVSSNAVSAQTTVEALGQENMVATPRTVIARLPRNFKA